MNPLIGGRGNFALGENVKFNLRMGYALSPFGDFIDENVWVSYKTFNLGLYIRQYQNRNRLFNAFGINLSEYQPFKRLSINLSGHFWQQPAKLDLIRPVILMAGLWIWI